MTIETLATEIDKAIQHSGVNHDVARAALNDFMRSLHEVFTKSGCDQLNLLSQVQTVFGPTHAQHLRRVISDEKLNFSHRPSGNQCPLSTAVTKIWRERGIAPNIGRGLFSHLLKALDEERFGKDGSCESSTRLTYWAVGDEAAYHLGGLQVDDDRNLAWEEMKYLDSKLVRFNSIVERWQMELAWEKQDQP